MLIPFYSAIKRNNNKFEYVKYINENCQINLVTECNLKLESEVNFYNNNYIDNEEEEEKNYFGKKETPIKKEKNFKIKDIKNPFA